MKMKDKLTHTGKKKLNRKVVKGISISSSIALIGAGIATVFALSNLTNTKSLDYVETQDQYIYRVESNQPSKIDNLVP